MSNLTAFLTTIAKSEGVAELGDRGYNVLVGSRPGRVMLFDSYRDHPRVRVQLNDSLWSSAAGRYQILARYFDHYKTLLNLPDFGPESQDAIALQMIREQGAYADAVAGRFDIAAEKVANLWASFPGAGYSQHENKLADLRQAFTTAGGVLA